jgi:hypothetical protein
MCLYTSHNWKRFFLQNKKAHAPKTNNEQSPLDTEDNHMHINNCKDSTNLLPLQDEKAITNDLLVHHDHTQCLANLNFNQLIIGFLCSFVVCTMGFSGQNQDSQALPWNYTNFNVLLGNGT